LRDRHFANDQEVKEAVRSWLAVQPKAFCYSEGKQKLMNRWTKFDEKEGDCIKSGAIAHIHYNCII
jgi:hypothetical protein